MSSPDAANPHAAIAYDEADRLVGEYARRLRCAQSAESVSLLDALGRVLAEAVLADRQQPPFARSTRDGFACRAQDTGRGMQVQGLLRAGELWQGSPVSEGDAIEIMTGAPLPAGADCVVMVEHVVRAGERITLAPGRHVSQGENYIPEGAEARLGATLVAVGTRLQATHVAAAASVGLSRLDVYHRPRVAIFATGDELVPVAERPRTWQIRNSNSYSLAAQVLALGCEPVLQPIVADSAEALMKALRAALEGDFDLLLLTGGVSMGKYDLVEEALASLGGRFAFTGVRMQPGKPVVFGEFAGNNPPQGLPFFGLPGNPASTLVTFALFAAPVLAALGGQRSYAPAFAEARLTEPIVRKPNLRRFLPGRLDADANTAVVRQTPWQGSGDIAGTAQANCMIVVPELIETAGHFNAQIEAGESVRVLLL